MRTRWHAAPVALIALVGIVGLACGGTPEEEPQLTADPATAPIVCWHDVLSDYHCPDSAMMFVSDANAITGVSLTINLANGQSRTMRMEGPVDGLFITRQSVESFLVRYYDATDTSKARSLREYLRPRP